MITPLIIFGLLGEQSLTACNFSMDQPISELKYAFCSIRGHIPEEVGHDHVQ